MKIIVTGSRGYIGEPLSMLLSERGHDVTGVDTGLYTDGLLYDGANATESCNTKDIRHITEKDLKDVEAVVHLAELSNDPLGQLNPGITYKINHKGSVALARKCKKAGVTRFVYSSSCSIYGAGFDGTMTEESETNPLTTYAKCKVLVERDVSQLADDDFSPTFLRNATAYGPSPRMRFDLVLNNLAGLAWTTKRIKMTSDGMPWRPLVHVLDICEAMVCAIEAPREVVHNQVFNVGDTSENYQVREIARTVRDVFPGCELSFGSSDGDNRSYRVSFEKINASLPGFRCRRNIETGAAQLRDLFERIGLTSDMFCFRAYTRVKQIKYLIETKRIDEKFFWIR